MRVCLALHGSSGLLLLQPSTECMGERAPVGQADALAGFPQEGREGQGWKESQPCKNTQLEAAIREATVSVKVK